MQQTQSQGSKPHRGWPPKKWKTAKSGELFSLDFLFIEQGVAAEATKRGSQHAFNTVRGPAERGR